MEEFLDKLKKALQKERKAEGEKMEEEIRAISGKEREEKGRAVLSLHGKIIGEEFGYKIVKYKRKKEIVTEMVSGDSVLLSSGNPLKGVNGTVIEVGNKHIIVATDHFIPSNRVDLYVNDITFRRMYENLENLNEEVFSVLEYFFTEKTVTKPLKEEVLLFDQSLNKEQKEAVSLALGSRDFFILHGPFGTGKTKTTAEVILQEVKIGRKVLATAESNVATDNLIEELYQKAKIVRLGHPARVSEKLKKITLSCLLENDKEYSSVKKLRDLGEETKEEQKKYKKPLLSKKKIMELSFLKKGGKGFSIEDIFSMSKWISLNEKADSYYEGARSVEEVISKKIIEDADVVLATNSSSALSEKQFDVVVVDEASQATIPSILIPLSKAKRFILVGDHKQLPPTVISAEAQILKRTLFEQLIENFPQKSSLLNLQYRMNNILMQFPSEEFYDGKLKAFFKDISLKDLGVDDDSSLLFIDTKNLINRFESRKKESFSIHNKVEAEIVKDVFNELIKKGLKKEQIGVITPYEDQAELIKQKCNVEAHTVDGYQGQEREVIIISFVRSNKKGDLGFLKDMRRLNVSLTRARRKLILIGDTKTLSSNKVYRRLINFSKTKGVILVRA